MGLMEKKHGFTLSSPVMRNGGVLPRKYAGNRREFPGCDGDNISLPLQWKNMPEGTRSLAIAMLDPLGRYGVGIVHWVAYDIPPNKTSFEEGEANRPAGEFVAGRNNVARGPEHGPVDFRTLPGTYVWEGPCPRLEVPRRSYTIVLIATRVEPGTLKPGLSYYELMEQLYGRTIEATDFIVRYR